MLLEYVCYRNLTIITVPVKNTLSLEVYCLEPELSAAQHCLSLVVDNKKNWTE